MEGRVKMYIPYLHITAAAIVVLSSFLAIRTLIMVSTLDNVCSTLACLISGETGNWKMPGKWNSRHGTKLFLQL